MRVRVRVRSIRLQWLSLCCLRRHALQLQLQPLHYSLWLQHQLLQVHAHLQRLLRQWWRSLTWLMQFPTTPLPRQEQPLRRVPQRQQLHMLRATALTATATAVMRTASMLVQWMPRRRRLWLPLESRRGCGLRAARRLLQEWSAASCTCAAHASSELRQRQSDPSSGARQASGSCHTQAAPGAVRRDAMVTARQFELVYLHGYFVCTPLGLPA